MTMDKKERLMGLLVVVAIAGLVATLVLAFFPDFVPSLGHALVLAILVLLFLALVVGSD